MKKTLISDKLKTGKKIGLNSQPPVLYDNAFSTELSMLSTK